MEKCTISTECQKVVGGTDLTVADCRTIVFDESARSDPSFYSHVTVWWCTVGKVRLHPADLSSIDLSSDEVVVLYGNARLSFEDLAHGSQVHGCVFSGNSDEDVFNHLGFFNGLLVRSAFPARTFDQMRDAMVDSSLDDVTRRSVVVQLAWTMLSDILVEARAHGDPEFLDAIRTMNHNSQRCLMRLDSVYREMGISRPHLHQLFSRNDFASPGVYMAGLQLRKAHRLLRDRTLSIADIAHRCGFKNSAHFATFFKRHTGLRPNEERRGGTTIYGPGRQTAVTTIRGG